MVASLKVYKFFFVSNVKFFFLFFILADIADSLREQEIKQLPGSRLPLLLLKDRMDTFGSTLLELSQLDNGQRYEIIF
jgi:hypothetical protein